MMLGAFVWPAVLHTSGHVIEYLDDNFCTIAPICEKNMGRYQVLFHEKKNIPMVFLAQIADTRCPVAHISMPNQHRVRIET